MDLGELQVFLMVAKEGSFSRAAERLYRTQPAISLGIRKLEDSLGQPLFVRGVAARAPDRRGRAAEGLYLPSACSTCATR